MLQPTIACPSCNSEIKLTESLAAPLLEATRAEFQQKLAAKDALVHEREAKLALEREELSKRQAAVDSEIEAKLAAARRTIAEEEGRKAQAAIGQTLDQKARELEEARALLVDRDAKLVEAQAAQVEALRLQRELEEGRRELHLTIEKKVAESLEHVRLKAKAEAEGDLRLKVSEKEEQIAGMQRQIEDLKRRAEQGSQQLQGEASELDLEVTLSGRFPLDLVEPVAKGQFGADLLQRVVGQSGVQCGTIIWECKRTKNWSNDWLGKLRADQRTAGAEIAVLVSSARKEVETFAFVDGVWVTDAAYAVPLAMVLRQGLIEVANARQVSSGQQSKMELVYQYLTGSRFRHRVEAIVERISDMQVDLERERKAMTKMWAKRDAQIHAIIEATVGMHGDLQGIAGRAIQEIEGLELPLIEDGTVAAAAE